MKTVSGSAFILFGTLLFSSCRAETFVHEKSMTQVFNGAKIVVAGNIKSISIGECGPDSDVPGSNNVGYAYLHVSSVLKGGNHFLKKGEIRVCSPIRMLLGETYILSGYFDSRNDLVVDTDGIVMVDPLCLRFFRIDYRAPLILDQEGNRKFVSLGDQIPRFDTEISHVFGEKTISEFLGQRSASCDN